MTNEELTDLLTAYTDCVEKLIREKGYHRGTVLHTLAVHSPTLLHDLATQEPPKEDPDAPRN